MVCSSIIGACLRATALTHTLTDVPRTDYNIRLQPWSFVAAPHDLFPDAEGAPEGHCTHVIMVIFAAPHDLFPDAESARFCYPPRSVSYFFFIKGVGAGQGPRAPGTALIRS